MTVKLPDFAARRKKICGDLHPSEDAVISAMAKLCAHRIGHGELFADPQPIR
jgi:hypothetical protein